MKIAIAIPVKDEEPRVHDLLKSLEGADVDLIAFFDDYSTDFGTVPMLLQYSRETDNHIIVHIKLFPKESTRMSEKRNIILQKLKDYDYVLFNDADERFDPHFLQNIREIITNSDPCISFAFRRVNLPGAINYPDLQVRLVKNIPEVEWRGEVHDQLYSKSRNKPLVDFLEELSNIITDTNEYYCLELEKYTILHLERRTDSLRPWWKT